MRVVVTGAAGDPTCSQPLSIGAAAAIELAGSAEAMWLIDRNGPGLKWTRDQLPPASDEELVECDLADPVVTSGERLVGRSVGIEHVWVNGTPVLLDGKATDGAHPGQILAARP
jgi:NAD(P)-dependent dehydrogenase (short-subunit alcohol dehydrogenase family)